MFKIKSGELKPKTGFIASRSARQDEKVSTQPLAFLGIEFKNESNTKNSDSKPKTFSKPIANNSLNTKPAQNFNQVNKNTYKTPFPVQSTKVFINNKQYPTKDNTIENKSTIIKHASLSSLNKQDSLGNFSKTIPTKEASEEKKTSLKELLDKVALSQNKVEEKVIQPEISEKEIDVPTPPSDYWQKRKAPKEVPEDILRQVLE